MGHTIAKIRARFSETSIGKAVSHALEIVQKNVIWRLSLLAIGFALIELATLFALREFLLQLLSLIASDTAVSAARSMLQSPIALAAAFMIMVFVLRYFLSLFFWRRTLSLIMGEQVRITNSLFAAYISRSYDDSRNTEKSSPAQTIFLSATRLVHQFLLPLSMVMVELVVAIAVGAALLFIEPVVSIAVALWLILFLGLTIMFGRNISARAGKKRWAALNQMRRLIDGAFGDLRVIKLSAAEEQFCGRMDKETGDYAAALIEQSTLDRRPIYARELALAGTMIVALVALILSERSTELIGEGLILFAAASVRLLPAVQRVGAFTHQLRGQAPDLSDLVDNLNSPQQVFGEKQAETTPLFQESIRLDNVSFGQNRNDQPILNNVSIEVEKSRHISISGHSGAGKSTLLMLLCGLLEAEEGRILVDGVETHNLIDKIRQANVALVPQDAFIADMPILENLSFPNGAEDIDRAFGARTLEQLGLPSIADGTLETVRRFSGGEKQRLAIARALCQKPELLLLDEATSQLDGENTRIVFNYISQALPQTTVIVVSHQPVPEDLPIAKRYQLHQGRLVTPA